MSLELPDGLESGFRSAAGELGMATTAWLFLREVARLHGATGVAQLRDALGRTYPVLDAVASSWLKGRRGPSVNVEATVEACAGARRVVVAGMESAFLDALTAALPETSFGLLRYGPFPVNWERLAANYDARLELLAVDDFQRWAGARSVMLTFAYGVTSRHTHVSPVWLRACGPDVRTQFREFLAWDVIGEPMAVYPRWLVQVPREDFTCVVTG